MQYPGNNQEEALVYKTIIEASPFPIYLCLGEQLIVQLANQATLAAWGKTSEVMGQPFQDILPELENQPFRKLLLEVFHSGKSRSFIEHKADIIMDGRLQTFYYNFSYQPFKNLKEEIIGVFCIANDVTPLVLAREKLKSSEESSRLAIEAARLGTFDKDLISGEIFWDERCRELFAVSSNETVTYEDSFLPGIHPQDRERVDQYLKDFAFVKNLSNGEYDVEYRIKGGATTQSMWVRSRGKVYFDGDLPIRFIGTVFDITDIKTAIEQQSLLVAIIESSNDAIISKDLNGIVESWNEAATRMFGYTSEEMIGQSIFKLIPAAYHAEEERLLTQLRAGKRIEHFETKRLTKDLRLLDISLTISPIKDKLGNVIGISKIARDVTGQKLMERQKNEFFTIASHELKTPLTTIKSYVQILLAKAQEENDPFKINALSRVERQSDKMTILIQNFINNARLIEGELKLKIVPFKLQTLLQEVVRNAEILSQSHQIIIDDFEQVEVMGDPKKIAQVLDNLLSNAFKYSPPTSQVVIRCSRLENQIRIAVTDQGIGIHPKDQERIFERFFRVKNEGIKNVSGFGIGLYLAAEILKLHGYTIYVESEEAKGSTFYFNLSIKDPQQ